MDEGRGGARGDGSTGMSIPEEDMPGPVGQSVFRDVILPMGVKHLDDSFISSSLQFS
jgi:hypothetical protein